MQTRVYFFHLFSAKLLGILNKIYFHLLALKQKKVFRMKTPAREIYETGIKSSIEQFFFCWNFRIKFMLLYLIAWKIWIILRWKKGSSVELSLEVFPRLFFLQTQQQKIAWIWKIRWNWFWKSYFVSSVTMAERPKFGNFFCWNMELGNYSLLKTSETFCLKKSHKSIRNTERKKCCHCAKKNKIRR